MSTQLYDNLNLVKDKLNIAKQYINSISEHKPLPTYIELEYIESTGTQYINTGMKASWKNLKFEISYQQTKFNGNWDFLLGASTLVNTSYATVGIRHSNDANIKIINNGDKFSITNSVNTKYNRTFVYNQIVTTGSDYSYTNVSESYNKSMYLFACNGTSVFGFWSGRIYQLKAYDNEVLTHNFIPVKRISDNVICMYDKVTEQFYTNIGTGTFIAGPIKE